MRILIKTFDLGAGESLTVGLYDDDSACGNWTGPDGSFACLNNLAHNGHGPGLEIKFDPTEAGLNHAANWFMTLKRRMDERRAATVAAEFRQRAARIAEKQKGLKGGLGARPTVAGICL